MELGNKIDETIHYFGTFDSMEISERQMSDMCSRRDPPMPEKVESKFPCLCEGPFKQSIPTAQDVEGASAMGGRTAHPTMVFRVNEIYAVKVSASHKILYEAYNFMYLKKMAIRTPKFYAVFSHQECDLSD